jgi:aminoglycoside phosphotransferase (APT) family kinase protein
MVPEPIGTVPAFHMWLQRKVPGVVATQLLPTSSGTDLSHRVAAAALKLHQSGVPADRRHTPADEMCILHKRLTALADARPELSSRLRWILDACAELAAGLPNDGSHGIHRDFYPDQVLVKGPRLYLLDLDLYAAGDPALDIGNFRGHIIEQSLRSFNRPDALSACERALSEEYCALTGKDLEQSIDIYTTLTLARHIAISTLFPERRHLTEALMGICEERLGRRSFVGTE